MITIPVGVVAFAKGAWNFLRAVPWQVWLALAIAGAWWWDRSEQFDAGYSAGETAKQGEWDAAVAAQQAADANMVGKQADVTAKVEVRYVDRIKVVREKGATIVREVTRYVPVDSCALPGGWRVLHDAAAKNEIPNPAVVADAAAVSAQDAASTVADNYLTCHETAARLTALQEWVRAQAALYGQPAGAEKQPAVREMSPAVGR